MYYSSLLFENFARQLFRGFIRPGFWFKKWRKINFNYKIKFNYILERSFFSFIIMRKINLPYILIYAKRLFYRYSLLWRRANARNVSQHILRRSAYPHQPYVDTFYVSPLHRRRPKLVLTGTSIPLYFTGIR